MLEEIKVNDLVILNEKKSKGTSLYNILLKVTSISKWDNTINVQDIKDCFNRCALPLSEFKLFNPNDYHYKHKNNIFTNKIDSVEHIYENGDIDYVIKFDDGRKRNLKECTLIKKGKPMRYKVITNLLENFPKDTIIQQYKKHDLYKNISSTSGALSKDLVENNPGFFQKLDFTEENINTLHSQIANLNNKFHAFGISEGFIKDFKEFESIVKQMGELL